MQPESTSQRPSLECFRSYVVLLSRWYWNPRLQGKLDPSDIVQQTLIQAWQGLNEFRGESKVEFRAWLRRILTRCQADFVRGFARDKRGAGARMLARCDGGRFVGAVGGLVRRSTIFAAGAC